MSAFEGTKWTDELLRSSAAVIAIIRTSKSTNSSVVVFTANGLPFGCFAYHDSRSTTARVLGRHKSPHWRVILEVGSLKLVRRINCRAKWTHESCCTESVVQGVNITTHRGAIRRLGKSGLDKRMKVVSMESNNLLRLVLGYSRGLFKYIHGRRAELDSQRFIQEVFIQLLLTSLFHFGLSTSGVGSPITFLVPPLQIFACVHDINATVNTGRRYGESQPCRPGTELGAMSMHKRLRFVRRQLSREIFASSSYGRLPRPFANNNCVLR